MRLRLPGVVLLAVAFVAIAAGASASDRYDPRFRFRTIRTAHFDIHFHQGEDALARRLASLAEQVRAELGPALGLPNGRVHVILVDQTDASNGWATPFPFNVIEITAAAPRGVETIGNTTDWLRLVFIHEYTHVVHLDRSRGLFAAGRRVFGRHPLALPNIFTPPWQIEGLATHYESARTGEGRVPAGDFRLLLDRAAASGRFASLDRASNDRVAWPAGHTAYLYGAYFHDYLADTYGEAALTRLADETAKRPPYLGTTAYRTVFGKPLGALWADFASASSGDRPAASAATRLTAHGFSVFAPVYSRGNRLYYSVANPHGFPSLRERLPDGGSREIAWRAWGGTSGVTPAETIVFDQLEFVRSVGLQADLYEVDAVGGQVRRLTRGLRAADPDVSPDGTTIVFVIQEADRRVLATMARTGTAAPAVLISAADTHFASPRWSPDGRLIAAERRVRGGLSEIVVIEATSGEVRVISRGGGRSVTPAWTPDGRDLLFASDAGGRAFQIHRVTLDTGEQRRLVNGGDASRDPAVSPDGRTLAFVGYTPDGHDLFAIEWSEAEWSRMADSSIPGAAQVPATAEQSSLTSGVTAYRPWPMLLPRFWTPIAEPDGDEVSIGAATAGADALGRHAYAVGAAWSTRARPDWYATYFYDRWRPTLFVTASDDTDPWDEGTARTREVNAGVSLPFRTTRRTQSLFASAHVANDRLACRACDRPLDTTRRRHALRGGWTFATARSYGYSISREDGVRVSAGGEWAPRAFGSTGASGAVVVDARAFVPAVARHGVLALRGAAGAAWGDDGAARVFGAGGAGGAPGGVSFDRDAVGLVRGFDADAVFGRRAMVVNADLRVPLAWIERGVGTWPAFARALHGAVFVDAGAAWNQRLARENVRVSAGVELSGDVVVGYVLPLTVTAGAAWRYDPARVSRGPAVFARVGHAF